MRLTILGDTHIPGRADELPGWVREAIVDADHVLHVGDFDSPAAYEEIVDLASNLTAVAGNMDPGGLELPAVETVDLADVRFVLTHGTGPPAGYADRVAETVAQHAQGRTVGVAGHTHEVMDIERDGYRLLNPGSATGAAPASEATIMTATLKDGALDVTVERD